MKSFCTVEAGLWGQGAPGRGRGAGGAACFRGGHLELLGEVVDELVRVVAEEHHLALVPLARLVTLEPVLVPALLLAQLAVPAELLQALGLDGIANLLVDGLLLPHDRLRRQ